MKAQCAERGFALIIVLWALALLSLVGSTLASIGRRQAYLTRNLLDNAVTQATAEGAVHRGIFALLDTSEHHWSPDGGIHVMRDGQHAVEVQIDDDFIPCRKDSSDGFALAFVRLRQAVIFGQNTPQNSGM